MRPDPDAEHPPRPVTGFFAHLTPEQKAAALAYLGPENIGEADLKLDAPAGGPVSQVHAGDGGEARRRRTQAMDELLAMDGEELMAEVDVDRAARPGGEPPSPLLGQAQLDRFAEWGARSGVTSPLNDPMRIIEDDGYLLTASVASIYAEAGKVMEKEGPMPLAADEPWSESDHSYLHRNWRDGGPGDDWNYALKRWGVRLGLPRARLVLVKG